MLAKQKEEMGAPLTKREKQAKSGIENITNKARFQNDKWYAACVTYRMRHRMARYFGNSQFGNINWKQTNLETR